jgi:hypothetical protein
LNGEENGVLEAAIRLGTNRFDLRCNKHRSDWVYNQNRIILSQRSYMAIIRVVMRTVASRLERGDEQVSTGMMATNFSLEENVRNKERAPALFVL